MKKLLEVLQYGDDDIRFNTDIDVKKDLRLIEMLPFKAAFVMLTRLWGGNETAVLAVIRSLAMADLAVSVNKDEMLEHLSEVSNCVAMAIDEAMQEFKKQGGQVQRFAPGIRPSMKKS